MLYSVILVLGIITIICWGAALLLLLSSLPKKDDVKTDE